MSKMWKQLDKHNFTCNFNTIELITIDFGNQKLSVLDEHSVIQYSKKLISNLTHFLQFIFKKQQILNVEMS
jgi:hypothetical protein